MIVLAGAVCAMRTVLLTRRRQHLPPAIRSSLAQRLLPELLELFRNRSFRILFSSALLFFIAQGVTLSLGLHANTFFWRLASDQVQLIALAFPIGLIIGAPLSGPIVSRMEKRTAVLIGLCGLILMQAGPRLACGFAAPAATGTGAGAVPGLGHRHRRRPHVDGGDRLHLDDGRRRR